MVITNYACIHYFIDEKGMINGSLFYILDYYLYIYNNVNNNIKFIGISSEDYRNKLFDIIKDKYDVNFNKNNFIWIKHQLNNTSNYDYFRSKILNNTIYKIINNIIKMKIDLALMNAETLYFFKGVVPIKKVLVQGTHFSKFIYKNLNIPNNCIVFEENNNYIKKLYLDGLRKPNYCDEATFINLKGLRYATSVQFKDLIYPHVCKDKKVYVLVDDNKKYQYLDNYSNIQKIYNHLPNFFSKFNKYVDATLNTYDYSPRLILEAAYLNKEIVYINNGLNDGAFKRYNDIINGNINKYSISNEDIIIKYFKKDIE